MSTTDDAQSPYSISVRFGDVVLQAGHTAVPNLVLNHYAGLGITVGEMMFTIHVWQYWWTEKDPYPSLNTIAARMNVTRRQVRNYTQSLKTKGFLIVRERHDPKRGQITSEYDFSSLIKAVILASRQLEEETYTPPRKNLSEGGRKNSSGGARKDFSSEEYISKNTQKEEDELSNIRMAQPEKGRVGTSEGKPVTRGRATSKGFATPGDILAERMGNKPSTGSAAPEGQGEKPVGKGQGRPLGKPRPEVETEEWQAIQRYVSDFMRELGDSAPLKSSTTRAYNLFTASGVSLATFLNKMYEARSRTQESSGNIDQMGDDPTYKVKRKTKAAYFFAVLEDVLHLIDDAERARREAGTGSKRGRPTKDAGDTSPSTNNRRRDTDGPFAAYVKT